MIFVDVLKLGSLKSPIGPTGTLRRLLQNREYIEKRGYRLSVYSKDSFCENKNDIVNIKSKTGLKENINARLKYLITKSKLLSILFIIREILEARKLAINYKKLNRKSDIVVFHDFFVYDQYERLIKNDAKKVLFLHSDGVKFEMLYKSFPRLRKSFFAKYLEKRYDKLVNQLDKLVFIAKIGKRNFLESNKNFDPFKTCFFHNGIDDLSEKQKNEEICVPKNKNFKYRLISTGTICERKGQYIILNALSKLNNDILKDVHVTFLGSGSQLSYLEDFVKKTNLSKHVSFEGSIDNSVVHKYLEQANIYILMSNNEGLPISIIEAMRSGLPIISTKIAGIPELVENQKNGILIDPKENQLIDLINKIDSYNWDEMGKHSRYRFENEFTFNKMREAYCNMLDTLKTN